MKPAIQVLLSLALALAARSIPAASWETLEDVRVSPEHSTATGAWQYTLRRGLNAFACGETGAATKCREHVLRIANRSAETLECAMRVDYFPAGERAPGAAAVKSVTSPMLVFPRSEADAHSMITHEGLAAEVGFLECKARAPYKRIAKVQGCRYEMMGKPFETYYPDDAKLMSFQGPVIVSFFLAKHEGDASEVTVAESSLVPALDAAALRYVRDQTFLTTCAGQRFDVLMRFKLRDQALAAN